MTPSDRPLLSGDGENSDISDDRQAEEEDALLTGQRPQRDKWALWREYLLLGWALVATVAVVVLAVFYQHQQKSVPHDSNDFTGRKPEGKRNLIFMVSDGMGPASLSLTRSYRQFEQKLPYNDLLVLDHHLIGNSRTRSASSLVTDSAAGATAFSCSMKSYNGAISVLPDQTPCGTVLEAAKRAGYMTGLVVTTRITDATPACFASHVHMRTEEDSIARQLIGDHPLGHNVDLIFGGGRCHFLPQESGGCRDDDIDVVSMARKKGYEYISDRQAFDGLDYGNAAKLPLLGLFAYGDIPFELDRRTRNETYPSLDEMARTAMTGLEAATKDSEKGFFLLIEGSRIDHAGHFNDPAAQVHEVMAYDKAFASVLDFLQISETEGVAVATSDHETGGLSVARQLHEDYPEYLWYPEVLANVSRTAESLSHLFKYSYRDGNNVTEDFVRHHVVEGLGISDATDEEINLILESYDGLEGSKYQLADMISRRAQIGWSSHGHSGM
jgi:alkaline phosphatase